MRLPLIGGMEKMRYVAPESVDEAVSALASEPGKTGILAGGTDLLVQMKTGLVEPDLIVDIKRINDLGAIRSENGGFRIGAGVCGAEMGEHAELLKAWPGVVEAVNLIGSTQIQGRATAAGNLCNASPAADSTPALIAAAAIASVSGPGGSREIPVEDFVTSPGRSVLEKGEIVVSLFLPARPENASDAYERFIPRTEMDIAVVGVGVSVETDAEGEITAARVGLGAVAPTPLLVEDAGKALVGSKLDDESLERCAKAAMDACNPIDDKRGTIDFRIRVAGALAKRVAARAYRRARGEQ